MWLAVRPIRESAGLCLPVKVCPLLAEMLMRIANIVAAINFSQPVDAQDICRGPVSGSSACLLDQIP